MQCCMYLYYEFILLISCGGLQPQFNAHAVFADGNNDVHLLELGFMRRWSKILSQSGQ